MSTTIGILLFVDVPGMGLEGLHASGCGEGPLTSVEGLYAPGVVRVLSLV